MKVVIAVCLLVVAVSARPQFFDQQQVQPVVPTRTASNIIPVLKREEIRDESGQFSLSYVTGDGTSVQEQGALKVNPDGEYKGDYSLVKQGSYQYTAPDGTPVQVTYIADENGFQPQGSVIPVAPAATF